MPRALRSFLLEEAAKTPRAPQFRLRAGRASWRAFRLARPIPRGAGRAATAWRDDAPRRPPSPPGLFPAGAGTYEANLSESSGAPYSAFGPFETASIRVTMAARLQVAGAAGESGSTSGLAGLGERAAGDVAGYYGRFPLPRTSSS